MALDKIIFIFLALFTVSSASVIPTVKVLQGPGSRTSLYGPDGSALESTAPGGTLVTDNDAGLVAAGPAVLPSTAEVIIGGGPAGKIVTSYTLAGPAVVPAVAPNAAVVATPTALATPSAAALNGLVQVPLGNFGSVSGLYDDGSYRKEKYK